MFSDVTATLTLAGHSTFSPDASVVLFKKTIAMLFAGIPADVTG